MILHHPATFQEDLGNSRNCRLSVFFLNFVMTVIPFVTKAEPISTVMNRARLITTVNVFMLIKEHLAFNYTWIN
jgi:hypothetical protein